MLHERHADAADHAADALTARRLRIHHAASAVCADDSAYARFAKIGIDRNLDEHRSKRMHRKSLPFVARLDVCHCFDWLADATHCFEEIVDAAARDRIFAHLSACRLDCASDARHRHRAAMHRRSWQPRIAKDEMHALDRQLERFGRDLRHRRQRAGAHVA